MHPCIAMLTKRQAQVDPVDPRGPVRQLRSWYFSVAAPAMGTVRRGAGRAPTSAQRPSTIESAIEVLESRRERTQRFELLGLK